MGNRKSQIAVVDDEPIMTAVLKSLFEDHFACEVETINSSIAALKRFKEKAFDVITLDHRMPELTGMELLRLIRTADGPNAKARVLLLTGYRDEAECAYDKILEEVIFLEKPASDADLLRWVNVMLNPKKIAG